MKVKLAPIGFLFILIFFCASCATNMPDPQKFSGATPLEWSLRLANSEMSRQTNALKWDYTMGLFTLSLLKLNEQSPDARYIKFSEDKIGSLIAQDGTIKGYKPDEYQLDAINPGKTALALWQITHDDKYKNAGAILRKQLDAQPRTFDGGFWHKQRYTNQMWLDGLYMGSPFYAEYAKLFGAPNSFDEVAKQIRLMDEHAYDAKTGLYFHGWDAAKVQAWANPQTGCSSNFWGRAIGWYAMALVDTLDYFPTNHPARAEIISTFQKLCKGVVKYQDAKTGLWYQVMDQGERKGNYLEATASAMFVYAMAKGVNRGYLPRKYTPAIEKGYDGIVKNLMERDVDGKWSLTQCCSVAGLGFLNSAGHPRDGSFDYYVGEPVIKNDLKGIGPFILAGIEMKRLQAYPILECGKSCCLAAAQKSKLFLVKVTNPATFARSNETVEIDLNAVTDKLGLNLDINRFAVKDCATSQFLDSQFYASEPDQTSNKLLFEVNLAPNETRNYCVVDTTFLTNLPIPVIRTFARYVPERMDDFAWESDRTAHRIYGQALIKGEGTITSGIDAWIKKDRRLIMDEMYRTKHYHEDNGSEMDDYRVGKSCGDGGIGIWDGKKLHSAINYRNWKLITTGPIRSEFEVTYDAWDAGGGRMVSNTKRISIDAGSWLSKSQDTFESDDKSPLTIGVGLAERACPTNRFEFIANDLNEGWQAYWQPEDEPKGTMGVAVILPKGKVSAFTNDAPNLPDSVTHTNVPQPTHEGYPPMRSLLAISTAKVGKPFTYYFGACWDRSGDFTNHIQWENYVKRFAERRDQPLQVTIGN